MPRTDAQNEQIRQATREKIIQSAMHLFAQHGYAHATTRRIAEQAGISTGLMYHYFAGKEQLLQAVFNHCMGLISKQFMLAATQPAPTQRTQAIVQTIFEMLAADPDFWGLFYMLRSQPAIMQIIGDDFREWTGQLRALMADDFAAAGDQQPEIEALLLYSLIEGTIQQYLLDPAGYPLDLVVNRIVADFTP